MGLERMFGDIVNFVFISLLFSAVRRILLQKCVFLPLDSKKVLSYFLQTENRILSGQVDYKSYSVLSISITRTYRGNQKAFEL